MKKIILAIVILIPLIIFISLIYKNQSTNPTTSSALTQTAQDKTETKNSTLHIDDLTFSWFQVTDPQNLKLLPNYSEKASSRDILTKYGCTFLANAGFYSKTNTPLGMTTADGKTLSNWQENALFDGLLSLNYFFTPRITRIVPHDNLKIAVQSGPIIKENGQFLSLRIQDDSEARRLVAAVTGENRLYFIIIYNSTSLYSGPLLANLPDNLESFEKTSGIIFADILNLDGGSASTFYTPDTNLSEFNSVGAFFCQP